MTHTISWMGKLLFWNELLESKILAVILCIAALEMMIVNESECATRPYDWS